FFGVQTRFVHLPASIRCHTRSAHSRSIMSAIALMRLLAYLGRPALSESPLLKELLPISSCAGTRFRSMGVLLYSLCLFSTSFLTQLGCRPARLPPPARSGGVAGFETGCRTWLTGLTKRSSSRV